MGKNQEIDRVARISDFSSLILPGDKAIGEESICFSKSVLMHNTVIGLFINWYEFGLAV